MTPATNHRSTSRRPMPLRWPSILRMLPVPACFFLVSCQAYQELRRQERVNYAYIKDARVELSALEQERSVLLETRSRLTAELAAAQKERKPQRTGTSRPSSTSRPVATIQRELQQTEQQIAHNAAEIERTLAVLSL